MREYELLEAVDNFGLYQEVKHTILTMVSQIQDAKLNQVGSMARRLSKALEPVVLSHIELPVGFTFEIKIVPERGRNNPAAGRMQIQWDDLLRTRHFTMFLFSHENTFRYVFVQKDLGWTQSLIKSFTTTMSHELVHLQQQTRMVKALLSRGYDYNKHLDIVGKDRSLEYHDRPIEAQAFAVEHAKQIFFNIVEESSSPEEILSKLKTVRSNIPRGFREFGTGRLFKDDPPYVDPYGAFEENPYLDRKARRARQVSEPTRRIYLKTFIKTLDNIIAEVS